MIKLNPALVKTRQFITGYFLEKGFAPTAQEIAENTNNSLKEVTEQLKTLAANRALVLHPHDNSIWIAHPFSDAPNAVWVETTDEGDKKSWWSNCPWCAFGIAALAKRDVTISAKLGGESETIEIKVIKGKPQIDDSNSSVVVHLPIPAARLWDNVIYSCSMQLFHRSESAVDEWCNRHRKPKGGVLSLDLCWRMAKGWYGPFLDPDWNRKSAEETAQYFASLELDLSFKPIN
jgi:hypothetical protein